MNTLIVKNKDLVCRYIDQIISKGDLANAEDFLSSDLIFMSPYTSKPIRGIEGFKQLLGMLRSAFPDFQVARQEILAEGNTVAARWLASGTHLGDFINMPPSGRGFKITGMSFCRIEDGKIVESWVSDDTLGMLKQLGFSESVSALAYTPTSPHDPKSYFTHVYNQNLWGGLSSRSGRGSEGEFAEQKIGLLRKIIAEYGVSSILDLGCGDFYWMKQVVPLIQRYHGVDIVEGLISRDRELFGSDTVAFQCLDLSNPDDQERLEFRQPDLIVCLDVFGHLLSKEVDTLLSFILDGIDGKLLLLVNRRDEGSAKYLIQEKTRSEGIDIEQHSLFKKRHPVRLARISALYPNDFFELYDLRGRESE